MLKGVILFIEIYVAIANVISLISNNISQNGQEFCWSLESKSLKIVQMKYCTFPLYLILRQSLFLRSCVYRHV